MKKAIRGIKRGVNKNVLKVPSIEQKVLDATNNESWGPHGTHLADLAQASRNYHDYQMIMSVIWKRLSDTGKNWRHVFKGLTVLEYLVANGSERVIEDIREHGYQITALANFQYIDSSGRDQGSNIRKKSQILVALVNDKEKIQEVREKAAASRDKFRNTPGDDRYGGQYGNREEDRNGYGREREWNDREDENRGRSGSNEGDYGTRSQGSDRDRDRSFEDDSHRSSRGSNARVEDASPDGSQLESKLSGQSSGVPPSYEDAVTDGDTKRDVEISSPQVNVNHQETPATTTPPPPAVTATTENDGFDFFDPRGDFPAAAAPVTATVTATATSASNGGEMDLFGSLADSFSSDALAVVPSTSITTEVEAPANSSNPYLSFETVTATSASGMSSGTTPFGDPFGDGPFRADGFSAQLATTPFGEADGTSFSGFGDGFDSSFDILADILPPPGPSSSQNAFQPQTTQQQMAFPCQNGQPPSFSSEPNPFGDFDQPPPTFSSQAAQAIPQPAFQVPGGNQSLAPSALQVPQPSFQVPGGQQQSMPQSSFQVPAGNQSVPQPSFQVANGQQQSMPQPSFQAPGGNQSMPQSTVQVPNGQQHMPQSALQLVNGQQSMPPPTFQVPSGNQSMPQPSFQVSGGQQSMPPLSALQVPNGQQSMAQPTFQVPSGQQSMPQSALQVPNGQQSIPQPSFQVPNGQQQTSFEAPGGNQSMPPLTALQAPNGQQQPGGQPSFQVPNSQQQSAFQVPNGQQQSALQVPAQSTQSGFAPQNASFDGFTCQLASSLSQPGLPSSNGQSMLQPGLQSQGSQSGFPGQSLLQPSFLAQGGFPSNASHPGGFPTSNPQPNNLFGGFHPQTSSQVKPTPTPQYNPPSNFYQQQSQPSLTPSTGALALVPSQQPADRKFETKSTVWTDTLNRGLVNLNISGAKTNPLSDIGIDFDAINRKEKRLEKPSKTPVTSNVTMGKAMGSGSGMGRAGAGVLRPAPNPMAPGPGIGMGMGAPAGIATGYGGLNQQQPMGIGMGMNSMPPHNMGMGMGMNMGQGYPMQPGFPPGSAMPGNYNPMMGRGAGYGQQPYGGGYR